MRFLIPAAAAALLAAPLGATDLQNMTDAERAAFGAEVRDYLVQNPEVLIEVMQVLREREAAAEEAQDEALLAAHEAEIFNDGISWVGGNPDGDVTIVEFLDYRCGYCRRAHDEMAKLLKSDGNIRWVVKELPILGPDSDRSAQLAVSTLRKLGGEAYGRLHDVLMTFEGPVTEKTLPIIAKRAEIDLNSVLDELGSDAVGEHIARVRALADTMNITGTPAFVIGDTIVRGYIPAENMEIIVAEERDKAG